MGGYLHPPNILKRLKSFYPKVHLVPKEVSDVQANEINSAILATVGATTSVRYKFCMRGILHLLDTTNQSIIKVIDTFFSVDF